MPSFIPVDFNPFAEVREIEKITFTNEPQREIWLSCIIGGDEANLSYNESVSLKIEGDLNASALKKAVDNLVRRHEALRATISPDGEILIIYKDYQADFEPADISNEGDAISAFSTFLRSAMDTPLNIQEGPLFKVFLHKTAPQEYYFTIIKHHIIGDGWSTGIMLEDLSQMYNAYIHNNDITLAPPFQLSDYASAQASFKLTPAYKETEDYWVNLYSNGVPVLDMPTDHPRQSPRSYKGNRSDHQLSKEMVAKLKSIGAKAGASLVTTLLAAFEVFLYKETQQRDVVVGLPASGQAATGLTNVVGHCVNLLPLKSHVDPSSSFSDYLKKRKKEVLDAYDHQRLTFGELLKKLYIPRDASRIALVPVMFNIDMGMDNAVAFDGLKYKLISNPRAYENFEVYLNATGSKDGIILEWSYNTDLFEPQTIEAFNSHYYAILEAIIANPKATIANMIGENAELMQAAPVTEVHIPLSQTINTLFADTVKQYADKTAITFKNQSLTYAQLSKQTDQMAGYLIQNGIGVGDIVALSIDRSIEMLVCLLAVLKVGGVYLPLDPEYPHDRTSFMLNDANAKMLLTSRKYKSRLQASAKEVIVEDVWAKLNGSPSIAPAKVIDGKDLAYILYTSGSTGKPKGVQITHRNLANFLLSMQAAPGIGNKDRLLAITSISFDIAGLELYLPLVSGAELVLADTDATKDGRLLLQLLEEKHISIMQATPSTWQMLLDSGWQKWLHLKILSGGEALPKELADKLLGYCMELWNMYGPTETTIWSTVKQVLPQNKQLSIGLPINNTRIYIMDEQGKPLPVNQAGEIYIGGAGVANGYLHRPELTAEKFVPDTYSYTPDAKLYKTGDLGKVLYNGEIQCLGRIDYQVKIRGHRIELGEIETEIAKLAGIKQAVVLARQDTPMDKRLVAYVTLSDDPAQSGDPSSWKDRWDALYTIGAEDKQNLAANEQSIDGTLLEQLDNSEELTLQLAEWLKISVARIKEINAKRIYEIGSGAGQILFEVAPEVEYYMATDYAQAAITNINTRLAAEPAKWAHVKAGVAAADDFSAISNTSVDLVLINSVAQYFPNADYMIAVIRQAVNAIKNGGCVFIGDMQGKNSLEMYHAMDYLPRAADTITLGTFKDVVANRVRIEEEFVADPAFFYMLPKLFPQITGVDVQLRKGELINETTKYHYDIWLYVAVPVTIAHTQLTREWKDVATLSNIEQLLVVNAGSVVEVQHVLNARTAKDYRLLQLLQSTTKDTPLVNVKLEVQQVADGIHPDKFWELADKLNYKAHIRWTADGTDGMYDVVFIPASQKLLLPSPAIDKDVLHNIYDFARAPLSKNEVHVAKEVVDLWKEGLRTVLPAYMVPDDFVALKNFPLTPNAKIDRKALPKPQPKKETGKSNERITFTPNEQLVTSIWSDILGLNDLKPSDDFFQLGGHSLLAVKVMVAIEKQTGKRLTIATLFNNSTIEKLARQLADDKPVKQWDVLVPIKTEGKKTPIFLIHGGGLNIVLFESISEYFDAEQPIYGIQALGLNNETDIPNTIQGIATRYIKDVLDVNPDGPYALAGYSLGGFIAFEMARQLKAMGKEIKFLGIMDTYAGNNYDMGDKFTRTVKKVARQFNKIPFYAKSFMEYPKEALEYQMIMAQRKLQRFQATDVIVPEDAFTNYETEIYKKYSFALDAFLLTPLDVKVTLFRVEKRLYFLDDLVSLGWDKFAVRGVDVHEVPGDHKTFLYPPHSKRFAQIVQQVLDSTK